MRRFLMEEKSLRVFAHCHAAIFRPATRSGGVHSGYSDPRKRGEGAQAVVGTLCWRHRPAPLQERRAPTHLNSVGRAKWIEGRTTRPPLRYLRTVACRK